MNLTIEQRVAKGVEYMDTYGPADWRDLIDLEILDIFEPELCILGQVFGDYWLHRDDFASNTGNESLMDYGFDCFGEVCEEMNAEWRRVLSSPTIEQEEC